MWLLWLCVSVVGASPTLPWNLSAPWYFHGSDFPFNECAYNSIVQTLGLASPNNTILNFPLISVFDHDGLCLSNGCLQPSKVDFRVVYEDTSWSLVAENSSRCKFDVIHGSGDNIQPLLSIGLCHDLLPTSDITSLLQSCNQSIPEGQSIDSLLCYGTLETSFLTLTRVRDSSIFQFDVDLRSTFQYTGPALQYTGYLGVSGPFTTPPGGYFTPSALRSESIIVQSNQILAQEEDDDGFNVVLYVVVPILSVACVLAVLLLFYQQHDGYNQV